VCPRHPNNKSACHVTSKPVSKSMDLPKTTALVSGANRRLGKHLADQLISRGAGIYGGPASPEPLTPAPASSARSRTSLILPP